MGNQPASSEPYYQIDDTLIAPSQTPLDQHLQRLEQLCRLYVITAPSNTPLIEEILAQVKTITDQDLHTYFNEYSDITN
jgi:branched-subunit amino acid aminotransferase/4-amino-4-deoxychorismate lyase